VDAGWNLVALPLEVSNSDYKAVFPPAIPGTLFAYENGGYVGKNLLESCRGYWLRFSQPAVVSIEGTAFSNCTISLVAGWNLIAGPSCSVPVSRIGDPGSIIIPGTIFGFDNGAYFPAETIEPGNSYWVRASQAGQITLNCNTNNLSKAAENAITSLPPQEDQYSHLLISDATGATQMLYITEAVVKPATKLSYSLPPIPPAGSFDVRFADDYRLNEQNEALIRIQARQFPLTLRAENLPSGGKSQYVIQEMAGSEVISRHVLQEGTSITITNHQTTTLKLGRTNAAPNDFSLEQNYPNPFNPATEIRYALPKNAQVSLIIYNALGQKVRTLVSAPQEAGFYAVRWDGRNDNGEKVASGLFIYRLKASDRVATKKMIMMQ
jgi:hypothetical protein